MYTSKFEPIRHPIPDSRSPVAPDAVYRTVTVAVQPVAVCMEFRSELRLLEAVLVCKVRTVFGLVVVPGSMDDAP